MNSSAHKHPTRSMLVKMLVGAIAGAVSMAAFLSLVGDRVFEEADPGVALASVVGVIYLILGLFVWLGMSAPTLGARFLNVENAEELREESGKLRPAAAVMVLTGVFLLILALSGAGVIALSHEVAAAASLLCLAGIGIGAWIGARRYDELSMKVGLEAGSVTLHVVMLVFGCWAALAHFGFTGWITPIGCVATLAIIQLVVSFVVVGRKGLLAPR